MRIYAAIGAADFDIADNNPAGDAACCVSARNALDYCGGIPGPDGGFGGAVKL